MSKFALYSYKEAVKAIEAREIRFVKNFVSANNGTTVFVGIEINAVPFGKKAKEWGAMNVSIGVNDFKDNPMEQLNGVYRIVDASDPKYNQINQKKYEKGDRSMADGLTTLSHGSKFTEFIEKFEPIFREEWNKQIVEAHEEGTLPDDLEALDEFENDLLKKSNDIVKRKYGKKAKDPEKKNQPIDDPQVVFRLPLGAWRDKQTQKALRPKLVLRDVNTRHVTKTNHILYDQIFINENDEVTTEKTGNFISVENAYKVLTRGTKYYKMRFHFDLTVTEVGKVSIHPQVTEAVIESGADAEDGIPLDAEEAEDVEELEEEGEKETEEENELV